jgi:hypothetical protein
MKDKVIRNRERRLLLLNSYFANEQTRNCPTQIVGGNHFRTMPVYVALYEYITFIARNVYERAGEFMLRVHKATRLRSWH